MLSPQAQEARHRPAHAGELPAGPCTGVLVVAVEQAVAVPFASRQLADLGARVFKVERPGGDFARGYDRSLGGHSAHFAWLNAGKESLTCDLATTAGRELLAALLARADVFVHNLAPGALARMGLDPAQVARRHPGLVVAGVSGYGSDGPYGGRKAYDLLVQAESGVLDVTGTEMDPCKTGISVADIAAGSSLLAAVLAALYERQRTGAGAVLEVTMLEAMAEWMGYPLALTAAGGMPPARTGARHATIAPYGPVRSAEGTVVFLAVHSDREWQALAGQVLADSALAADARFATNADRVAHRDDLDAVVTAGCAQLTQAQLVGRLEQARIAYGYQRSVPEVLEHPQLAARNSWRTVQTPGGQLRLPAPAVRPAASATQARVPAAGEDTAEILAWLAAEPSSEAADSAGLRTPQPQGGREDG